jgi:hypothetical protein
MIPVIVAVVVVALVFAVRRARRRTGAAITRNFTVEPPAGRFGHRKGERL